MRVRWLVFVIAVAGVVAVVVASRTADDRGPVPSRTNRVESAAAGTLAPQTMTVGAVSLSIEPTRIGDGIAVFRVSMDTHSGDLSVDLERSATLTVGGVERTGARWTGDPPDGHHRSGELTFRLEGEPSGEVVLSIDGFARPVEASWAVAG